MFRLLSPASLIILTLTPQKDSRETMRPVTVCSRKGKYLRTILKRRDDGLEMEVVVSHLPFRNQRALAIELLGDCLQARPTALTFGLGDYNATPSEMDSLFSVPLRQRSGLLTFDSNRRGGQGDPPVTTTGGNSYDNMMVLHSDLWTEQSKGRGTRGTARHAGPSAFTDSAVLPQTYGSDHYPIVSTWNRAE